MSITGFEAAEHQHSAAHDSATRHVRGAADYVDDLPVPANCLHAAVICSNIASGELLTMQLDEVLASPGVRVVIGPADIVKGHNGVGSIVDDEPLLGHQDIHYHGQMLALVVADNLHAARQAASKAKLNYREQQPALDVEQAYAAGSLLSQNLCFSKGDVDQQLALCEHKLERSYSIGGQEHFYLEGQIALAIPGEDDEIEIISSTQHPSEVQHMVAQVLGVAMHRVSVKVRRMGGGFGGKETQAAPIACLAALAAQQTQRAVKLRLDRDEDMRITGKRHPFVYQAQVGFNSKGDILALDALLLADGGWCNDLTNPVVDRAMFHADNAYYIPHMRVTGARVRTNTCSHTAFRGFGGPQGIYLIEQLVDDIARYLAIDAALVRRRNLYGGAGRNLSHYGQIVEVGFLRPMFNQIYRQGEYRKLRRQVKRFNSQNEQFKQGLALTPVKFGISFTLTKYNKAGALVHIYPDGSVQLNHGGTEMGQGLFIKVAQVVARELGLSLDRIRPMRTSTAKVANTSATAASSGTDLNGMAALDAAQTLRQRLTRLVRQHCQAPANTEVSFADNSVHVQLSNGTNQTLTLAEVAQLALAERINLSAAGYYQTPKIHWDRERGHGHPFYYFACGMAISRVIVDRLTGEYKLLSAHILHDVGNSINPAIDIGQIEGGFIQGVGWLSSEQLCWSASGELQTHAPATYKIPTARERPLQLRVELFNKANNQPTIYRSKAVGEPPLMLAFSVFMAIKDAIAACKPNERIIELNAPATPEQVLTALHE